jgi:hypothetical protein
MARSPSRPPHVGTLESTIRMGYGLWVHCDNRECHHRVKLDLEDLASRLVPELPLADLVARSVCSECGARWPRISISIAVGQNAACGAGSDEK